MPPMSVLDAGCLCSGHSSRARQTGHGKASHVPAKGSILGQLHHQPQGKAEHLQFLGAHLWNKKGMDRPCPLTPINAANLPWIFSIFKPRCVALSLISFSFKPLEGVSIFLSPQMEILHKCGPQQGTVQYGIKEPFINLKGLMHFFQQKLCMSPNSSSL